MTWPKRLQWNREQARLMASKGGKVAGIRTLTRSIARWQAMFPGVAIDAIRVIYKRGYNAGYIRGWHRAKVRFSAEAFDQGYRAGQLDAMKVRRSA